MSPKAESAHYAEVDEDAQDVLDHGRQLLDFQQPLDKLQTIGALFRDGGGPRS